MKGFYLKRAYLSAIYQGNPKHDLRLSGRCSESGAIISVAGTERESSQINTRVHVEYRPLFFPQLHSRTSPVRLNMLCSRNIYTH